MSNLKVGGEVDGYCTKCRMTLAHTILAMVGTKIARVRCNTCGGDHSHRSESGSVSSSRPASGPKPARQVAEKPERVVKGFMEQLAERDVSKARPYNVKDTFQVDELINHVTFGLGIVTAVRGDKIDIAFKGDSKTLIHGRGGAPLAKPQFSPPNPSASGPADKPVADTSTSQEV